LSSRIRAVNCRPHIYALFARAWSSLCCGLFSVTNRAHVDTSCITEVVAIVTILIYGYFNQVWNNWVWEEI